MSLFTYLNNVSSLDLVGNFKVDPLSYCLSGACLCNFDAATAKLINEDSTISNKTVTDVLLEKFADQPSYVTFDFLSSEVSQFLTWMRIFFNITNVGT